MAAIVRLKRRRNEEPVEILVLSCKKRKQDDNRTTDKDFVLDKPTEILETLKFAGTISEKETGISKHIRAAIRKEKLSKEYKQHRQNIGLEKSQETRSLKHLKTTRDNRYKVICSHRDLELDNLDKKLNKTVVVNSTEIESNTDGATPLAEADSDNLFYLYDIEKDSTSTSNNDKTEPQNNISEITCNSIPLVCEKNTDEDFVYDLYYTNSGGLDFRALQNSLTIQALHDDLVYDDDRYAEDDDVYDDDDDSNDEGNWRNDYPDEEPGLIKQNWDDDDGDLFDIEPLSVLLSKCNMDCGGGGGDDDDDENSDNEPTTSYEAYRKRVEKDLLYEYLKNS